MISLPVIALLISFALVFCNGFAMGKIQENRRILKAIRDRGKAADGTYAAIDKDGWLE